MDTHSPDSPLSDIRSDFEDEIAPLARTPSVSPDFEEPAHRPNKRQRTSGASKNANRRSNASNAGGSNIVTFDAHEDTVAYIPSDADISSDTDGSVPGSPQLGPAGDDDDVLGGQITQCKWEGCEKLCDNMDLLVHHLHEEHIHARQKKYSCEWIDCNRKGIPHASGYALRAHMRSHSKERPFYCSLPECDRAFTRSDALAKHMRTVHETEALRPSDPVPKHHSSNPQNRSQRLRLTFNKLSAGANKTDDDINSPVSSKAGPRDGPPSPGFPGVPSAATAAELEYEQNNPTFLRHPVTGDWVARFPPDISFTSKENSLAPAQLMVLLSRQIQWATEAGEVLRQQNEILEKRRKSEWIAKEVVLREFIDQQKTQAVAEEEADEGRRAEMMNIDEDGTVVQSKEAGDDDDDDGIGHGEIPPYPYAMPEELHQRSSVTGLA